MQAASLYGVTAEERTGRVRFRSSAYVHEENLGWLVPLFSWSILLQVIDVGTWAPRLAPTLGMEPDRSGHPASGVRAQPDGMLGVMEKVVIPHGMHPPVQIRESDFQEGAGMLRNAGLTANGGANGLSAYVPFKNATSLLWVQNDQCHPMLGHGLLVKLHLPPEEIAPDVHLDGDLILRLNLEEQSEGVDSGHFLGSWCLDTRKKDRLISVFVTFVPNAACTLNVFFNLLFSMLVRNTWAQRVLAS